MVRLPAAIQSLHHQLGIPDDYAEKSGLACFDVPLDLVSIGLDVEGREQRLRCSAANQWFTMVNVAAEDEVVLQVVSAYRSAIYQADLIQRCLKRGEELTNILSRIAAPGFSEHQSGCALDITTPGFQSVEEEFDQSGAFQWLTENAKRFHFEMTYPKDNRWGIVYEPWHWCFHAS